jgi:perosamine synthetase
LIEDAAHSLGANYRSRPVGSVAELTCFSFHPVKAITTGEGGAILTDNQEWAERLQRFRNHGMVRESVVVGDSGPWVYDVGEPAYNYRLSDIHCALGCSQLERLGGFIERRRQIAARYRHLLEGHPEILLPPEREWCSHAYHLFPIRVPVAKRADLYHWLRSDGFGVQVHYVPVNAFSAYRRLGHHPEDTPVTLEAYRGLLSIPCHQGMSDAEVTLVTDRLLSFFE